MYQPDAFARVLPPAPAAPPDVMPAPSMHAPVLLAYATQTGAAEGYARATAEQLGAAGIATQLLEFYDLEPAALTTARQALIVASTTYDGDPPDMAEEFARQYMQRPMSLPALQYGLLALGDRDYDTFCGFGRRLNRWLLASGAQALFTPVEVDDENPDALDRWFAHMRTFADEQVPQSAATCAGMAT